MSGDPLTVACPNCGKKISYRRREDYPYFPFCSRRCKLLDLGKWLDGEHRISETPPDASEPPGQ
jgi:hypothetical protein